MAKRISPLLPGSRWLLDVLAERRALGMGKYGKPVGITEHLKVPFGLTFGVDVENLRGLVRRGWVDHDRTKGIYTLNDAGAEAHAALVAKERNAASGA